MLVIVQGPPRSGKDTFVNELAGLLRAHDISCVHRQVGQTLKEATHALYQALTDHPIHIYPWNYFEANKETPKEIFLGLTPRQAYIDVHERLIKPLHGDTTLARMTAEHLARSPAKVKIASSLTGPNDVPVLVKALGAPIIIGLDRWGCTEWDNRRPIAPDWCFHNNGPIEKMRNWIEANLLPELL